MMFLSAKPGGKTWRGDQLGLCKEQRDFSRAPSTSLQIVARTDSGIGMSRYDLTDFEWRVIEPLLPNKPRGVPRVDDRRVLNGIFWVLRSGAP